MYIKKYVKRENLYKNNYRRDRTMLFSHHLHIQDATKRIDAYDQAGDYAQALNLARKTQKKCWNNSANEASIALTILQLEAKLLDLGYSEICFRKDGKPKRKVCQLLQILGMKQPSKKSIEEINVWSQDNLLRQEERWQLRQREQKPTDRFEPLREKLQPLLTALGFIKGRSTHFQEYTGAVVHGASLPTVRNRPYYLIKQWKKGIRFSDLYFLSSKRPLHPQRGETQDALIEDKHSQLTIRKDWKLLDFPKTECEMIQIVWAQSELPEAMKQHIKVHFIYTPMKNNLRPTTDDTAQAWLQVAPTVGNYLTVTTNPHINRQDLVIRTVSPQVYGFDTIGPAVCSTVKMAIILDELAQFIFMLSRNKKLEKKRQ